MITAETNMEYVDRLISMYQWSFTIFISILAIVLGFLGLLQWRLSSKQIENIKRDIKNDLVNGYNINNIPDINLRIEGLDHRTNKIIRNSLNQLNIFNPEDLKGFVKDNLIHNLNYAFIFQDEEMIPKDICLVILDNILFFTREEIIDSYDKDSKKLIYTLYKLLEEKGPDDIIYEENFLKLKLFAQKL